MTAGRRGSFSGEGVIATTAGVLSQLIAGRQSHGRTDEESQILNEQGCGLPSIFFGNMHESVRISRTEERSRQRLKEHVEMGGI